MISVLLFSVFFISHSQRQTATCDLEQFLDLGPNEELLDHARINSTDIVLTSENLILLDEDLNVLNTIQSPNWGSYQCNRVTGHDLSSLFFVACQSNGSNPFFVAYRQVNGTNYEIFGNYQYVSTANETFDKFAIVGNTLLIPQSSKIVFFTIVIQASGWYLRTTNYVLDAQFFNRTSLNITDFTFSPFTQDLQLYYKIFVIDYQDGILWVDAISRTNNLIPYNFGRIDLQSSYYISYSARFRGAILLEASSKYTQFIIQTFNDGTFQFEHYIPNSFAFKTSFNQYKDWSLISSVRASENVVAIGYQNYQKTVVISLFNIQLSQKESENENTVNQEPNDLLISSSINNLILYFISENRLVYRSDYDSLTRCKITNYKIE